MEDIVMGLAKRSWAEGIAVFLLLFLLFALIGLMIPGHRFSDPSLPREFRVRYILHFLYPWFVTVISTLVLFAFSYYEVEIDMTTKVMLWVTAILGLICSYMSISNLKELL